jgi:signal transduction histidine kinase
LATVFLVAEDSGLPWTWLNSELGPLESAIGRQREQLIGLPMVTMPQFPVRLGYMSAIVRRANAPQEVWLDFGSVQALDSVVVVPAFSPQDGGRPYGFPPRFRVEAGDDPSFIDSAVIGENIDHDLDPGLAPVYLATPGLHARYLRFTALSLCPAPGLPDRWMFCLGEIMAFSHGVDVARGIVVNATASSERRPQWSLQWLTDGVTGLGLPIQAEEPHFNGWSCAPAKDVDTTKWVQIDLGDTFPIDEVRLLPMHHPRYPEQGTYGFPPGFRIQVAADGDPGFANHPQLYYQVENKDYPDPGVSPLPLRHAQVAGRYVRITAERLAKIPWGARFALAEVEVWSGGKNVALRKPVSDLDLSVSESWSREALTDGRTTDGRLLPWDEWLADLARRRDLTNELTALAIRRDVAVTLAHQRGRWLVVAGAVLAIGALLGAWWRAWAARRRDLTALQDRIARDLHDELGSHLGSITLMSGLALRPGGDPRATMADIHRLSREAAASMRGIIWLVREEGRPPLIRLGQALRQATDLILRGCACAIEVQEGSPMVAARLDVHRHVYLFFREVAHNIARHAEAAQVEISLSWDVHRLVLTVSDDGRGFDPQTVTPGSGLANLRHRANQVRGTLVIDTAPGTGTRIRLEVPLT